MRNVLRQTIRKSLRGLSAMDRLSAAWPLACGRAMAGRGEIVEFEEGIVLVEVAGSIWLAQMNAIRSVLQHDLARIAGVDVEGIHFRLKAEAGDGVR